MIEARVTVSPDSVETLVIGRVTANIKRITFDLAALMDEYGTGGTASLWYRRPEDLAATKQNLQLTGTAATWDIDQEAIERPGAGEAQLYYTLSDGKQIKTNVFPVMVIRGKNAAMQNFL